MAQYTTRIGGQTWAGSTQDIGAAPMPEVKGYITQPGDTYASIAQKNNVPLADLIKANPQIDPSQPITFSTNLNLPTASSQFTPQVSPQASLVAPTTSQPTQPSSKTQTPTLPPTTSATSTPGVLSAEQIQKQAEDNLKAISAASTSGQPVDSTTARTAVQDQPSPTTSAPPDYSTDVITQGFNNLKAISDQYTAQVSNLTPLVDTYKNLLTEQNIPGLQTQLVNIENIINGSEDDIRREISAGGGFATESQIQGLVATRNKSLMLRAQSLQNLLTQKEDYVDKIMTLTGEDRKAISDRLDAQFGLQEKQTQLQLDLIKTQAAQDLKYQQFVEKQQNDAKARVQAMASTGALAIASDERLTQLSQDSGYDLQDLKDMRQAVKTNNSLKQQQIIINMDTKQQALDATKSVAQGVVDGTIPPPMSRTGAITAEGAKILAEAKKLNPNLNIRNLSLEWAADQRLTQTLSGDKFTNFRFRAKTVLNTIDEMRTLSGDLKRSGFKLANKAQLYAESQGVGSPVKLSDGTQTTTAVLATKYLTQAALLKDDIANLFSGSGSPTDKMLDLTGQTLDSNWSDAQLNGALDTVYQNVQFRDSAMASLKAGAMADGSTDGSSTPAPTDINSLRTQYNY